MVLLALLLEGCTRSPVHEPVTLTLLEEWTTETFNKARQQELQQFTRKPESKSSCFRLRSPRGKNWHCGKTYSGQALRGLTYMA